jgi:Amt family ammonium transporter
MQSRYPKIAGLTSLFRLAATLPALAQDAAKLNSGDTAWMLTSTMLVLMMTVPGLALF